MSICQFRIHSHDILLLMSEVENTQHSEQQFLPDTGYSSGENSIREAITSSTADFFSEIDNI